MSEEKLASSVPTSPEEDEEVTSPTTPSATTTNIEAKKKKLLLIIKYLEEEIVKKPAATSSSQKPSKRDEEDEPYNKLIPIILPLQETNIITGSEVMQHIRNDDKWLEANFPLLKLFIVRSSAGQQAALAGGSETIMKEILPTDTIAIQTDAQPKVVTIQQKAKQKSKHKEFVLQFKVQRIEEGSSLSTLAVLPPTLTINSMSTFYDIKSCQSWLTAVYKNPKMNLSDASCPDEDQVACIRYMDAHHRAYVRLYNKRDTESSDTITVTLPPTSRVSKAEIKMMLECRPMLDSLMKNISCKTWLECFCVLNFDLEFGQKIELFYPSSYEQIFDKSTKSDIAFTSFPDTDPANGVTYFVYRIRHKSQYMFCHVYFKQEQDSSSKRGCKQKSLVLITRLPFVNLYKQIVTKVGDSYFDNPAKFQFNDVVRAINRWALPKPNTDYDFSLLGSSIKYRTPVYDPVQYFVKQHHKSIYSEHFSPLTTPASAASLVSISQPAQQPTVFPFQQDVNMYKAFSAIHVDNLVKYWELMIQGEPIIVYSQAPDSCANAVLSLISTINPIYYGGNYYPYFTIQNSEFQNMISLTDPRNIVIGFSNPVLLNHFEQWTNLIVTGEQRKPKQKAPAASSSSEDSRKRLIWEYREGFFTTRKKFMIKFDKKALASKLVTIKEEDPNAKALEAQNSAHIQAFFLHLTAQFLAPLKQCFDILNRAMRTLIFRDENMKIFTNERIFNTLATHKHLIDQSLFQTRNMAEILQFYKQFVSTKSFDNWLMQQCREAFKQELVQYKHQKVKEMILQSKLSDVGIIDLFLRLRTEFEEERMMDGRGYFAGQDGDVLRMLRSLMEEVIGLVSEDLRESLYRLVSAEV